LTVYPQIAVGVIPCTSAEDDTMTLSRACARRGMCVTVNTTAITMAQITNGFLWQNILLKNVIYHCYNLPGEKKAKNFVLCNSATREDTVNGPDHFKSSHQWSQRGGVFFTRKQQIYQMPWQIPTQRRAAFCRRRRRFLSCLYIIQAIWHLPFKRM
jgi:hypothetical protein